MSDEKTPVSIPVQDQQRPVIIPKYTEERITELENLCICMRNTIHILIRECEEHNKSYHHETYKHVLDKAKETCNTDNVEYVTITKLRNTVKALENAIRRHRDERGDDRCYTDDARLYNILPEGDTRPEKETAVTIENCARFIECRQTGKEYVSPQRRIEELELEVITLKTELGAALKPPIPMILNCPQCSARHIDVGEFETKVHHTHACQKCGMVWRPSVTATVGVQFLPGFKDEEPK